MYATGKNDTIETVPGMGGRGLKENSGGSKKEKNKKKISYKEKKEMFRYKI
jgi:hypothetical protein